MNKLLKRIVAGIISIATIATLTLSATAVDWEATDVNYPGAPTTASKVDVVTLYHKDEGDKGVTANCWHNSHTNTSYQGNYNNITYIDCNSHAMTQKVIYNTNKAYCTPDVGTPLIDIPVQYRVSASTNVPNDVFTSKGTIAKSNS